MNGCKMEFLEERWGVKNLVSEDLYSQRCVKKKYCFNFFTV